MPSLHCATYSPFANDECSEIRFVPLSSPAMIANDELQQRAAARSTGKYTRHFVAMENAREIAFVSLDLLPVEDALAIYEIFVPATLRGRGIGGKLLDAIEAMARRQGYSRIRLAARPMGGFSQPQLAAWYAKRGYKNPPDSISTIVLEKVLSKR